MNHTRVTTVTGQEVAIPHEEVVRISKTLPHSPNVDEFHQRVEERNDHYLHNACENIRTIAERHKFSDLHGTEAEYKELLSNMMNAHPDLGDLIVEIIEQRIAHHHKEIYSE